MTDSKVRWERTGLEIAIIGMAGRFPGAQNIRQYWENLRSGKESIRFFSDEELLEAGVDPQVLRHPDYVKAKGNLDDYESFDAAFFDYTPREAEVMDPQVRLFHECVYEALEDAGYDADSYKGSIGLFAGASPNVYWQAMALMARSANSSEQFAALPLTDKDFMNTRVAYKLNLRGPSVTVDTACSTSLVAVHMASRALLTGDCKIAIAGGVTVTVPNKSGYLYQEGMILSPDGHCRAFDAKAQGTVGGEGCGVVVLKQLKQALADGDHIYAVIKGSAYNNDGTRKMGYTAPSIEGQAEVIRAAHRMSRIEAESIGYVEAHGTGTALGDPVEIEALKLAFQSEKKQYCGIGSVKTNIGHLDAAAGVAGLIKTALALQHKELPPSLHYQEPNPKIDFENSPFYVNRTLKKWERDAYPLRSGVSSFGIGGTNVHVILEEAPEVQAAAPAPEGQLFVLSAKTPTALEKMSGNLANHLEKHPHLNLADVTHTLQVGRKHFSNRQSFTAKNVQEAIHALRERTPDQVVIETTRHDRSSIAFLFSGQGSQYVNMGRDLYDQEPSFRSVVDHCLEIAKPLMSVDLKGVLYPAFDPEAQQQAITQTALAQPLLFIFEYALAKFLMHGGLEPQAMIGHSIGEYVAACLAGVFSLEEALEMVVMRGRLMQEMPSGSMLSVPLSEAEIAPYANGDLCLAAVNGSKLSVVSGPNDAIDRLESELASAGHATRRLHTSHAFHSQMMEPMLADYEEVVRRVNLQEPKLPFLSNVSGTWITVEEATSPAYWVKQLRSTVRFADALNELLKDPQRLFVEVGPGNALSTFVRKHPAHRAEQLAINLIRHPQESVSDRVCLLHRLGRLWCAGVSLNWTNFREAQQGNRVPLPSYPFERQRFGLNRIAGNLQDIKKGVSVSNADPSSKQSLDEWFYALSWERADLTPQRTEEPVPSCLLFLDALGVGEQLTAQLQAAGASVNSVVPAEIYLRLGEGRFAINPNDPQHLERLLQDLQTAGELPSRILHLWNVTGEVLPDDTGERAVERARRSYLNLLSLARACGRYPDHAFRMVLVTDGLQEVTGEEEISPEQALVFGAAQVISKEFSHLSITCLDLTKTKPGTRQAQAMYKHLATELLSPASDNTVALRGTHRFVRTVQPVKLPPSVAQPVLREEGVYVITGGLGGIGLTLAEHLAVKHRAKLILLGRSNFPSGGHDQVAQQISRLKRMEQAGAEVLILQGDIADVEQVRAAVRQAIEQFGALHGVIHAAGLPDGAMIQLRTPEMEASALAAKVQGTLALEQVLGEMQPDHPIDFFLLCSSLATVLAPIGQVGYCAANAFLDAFATSRRAIGLPVVAVNWDSWQEVGMRVQAEQELAASLAPEYQAMLRAENDLGLFPSEGIEVFERILANALSQVMVSTHPLPERMVKAAAKHPLDASTNAEATTRDARSNGTRTKQPATNDDVEQMMVKMWQAYFGLPHVGVHDNFFDLGATSLDLLQLNSKLQQQLNMEIPATSMFTYPTIYLLAQSLRPAHATQEMEEPSHRAEAINEGKNRLKQRLRKRE